MVNSSGPRSNPGGTWLQQAWASPYFGAPLQGGFVDPALGLTQLGGHLEGLVARNIGLPQLDLSGASDRLINNTESNLSEALRVTGTDPNNYKYGRLAGAIGTAFIPGPAEIRAAALAEKGVLAAANGVSNLATREALNYGAEKIAPGVARGAVRNAYSHPVEQKDQDRFLPAKAEQIGAGALYGGIGSYGKAKAGELYDKVRDLAKDNYNDWMDGDSGPGGSGPPNTPGSPSSPAQPSNDAVPVAIQPSDSDTANGDNPGAKAQAALDQWQQSPVNLNMLDYPSQRSDVSAADPYDFNPAPALLGGTYFSLYPGQWPPAS